MPPSLSAFDEGEHDHLIFHTNKVNEMENNLALVSLLACVVVSTPCLKLVGDCLFCCTYLISLKESGEKSLVSCKD